jgi:hypothetical protein
MTIWLLALVLLASLAGMGYRQGAIRVAFALLGIIFGALLAVPLGRLLKPLLVILGLKNPVLAWALGPFIVFLVISLLFKLGGRMVHLKVDVYYKYKSGDLRLALWERLNQRLGLCLGVLNGTVYLILLAFVIYAVSYWTVQVATSDTDPRAIRWASQLGQDLERTGLHKVARAVDGLSPDFYDAADFAGLIYHNPLAEARLSRYPGFLGLAERPEFRDLGNDTEFANLRAGRKPIHDMLEHPKVQAITGNPDELKLIWATVVPDLKDVRAFLETGKSAKYTERLLGRWQFDVRDAVNAVRRARPTMSSTEMQKVRRRMAIGFAKTSLVAMADQHAVLKNVPRSRSAASAGSDEVENLEGQWKSLEGNKYQFVFAAAGQETFSGTIEGDRLTLNAEGMVTMPFDRED